MVEPAPPPPETTPGTRTLWLRLQNLLADQVSTLPTLAAKIGDVRRALEERGAVGLIFLTIPRADDLEAIYGWRYYDEFLADVGRTLARFHAAFLKPEDFTVVRDVHSSEFIVFVRPSAEDKTEEIAPDRLDAVRRQLADFLETERRPEVLPGHRHGMFVTAAARVVHNLFSRPERLVLAALDDARRATVEEVENEMQRQKELLKRIIVREEVDVFYQPIVFLGTGEIFGFEALSTTKAGSGIEGAEMLFALADEVNLSTQLDRVCRRRAFAGARRWLGAARLFLNTNPQTVEELGTRDDAFYHFFENAGVPPQNVVLEITERSAIGNLAVFEATLRHFREHGSGVAVDDAGAGYASLNTIARLKPDFLKFDMALVRDIDQDRVKQELLTTVQDLARRVNARVIAEGIETPGEFATLARMGVELGQGYFFARPKPPGEIEPHFPHEPAKIAYFPTAATPPAGDPRGGPGDG